MNRRDRCARACFTSHVSGYAEDLAAEQHPGIITVVLEGLFRLETHGVTQQTNPCSFSRTAAIAVLISFDRLAGWKACPTGSGRTGIGNYFREPLPIKRRIGWPIGP